MSLKKKLWSEDLTLDDLIKKCHLFEQQKESMELYGTSGQFHESVNLDVKILKWPDSHFHILIS